MPDAGPVLVTPRLVLRPFAADDADELLAVFRDPDMRRFLLDDKVVPAEWVHEEIATSDRRFGVSGAGLWSIRLAGGHALIGFAGFREFFDPPQLQLLYGLLPSHWGCGFATEAAMRVCAHGFEALGFAEIRAAIDVPNVASARVLQRLGMTQVRTSSEGPGGTAYFRAGRDEWLAACARAE
jgi:ribosomal-protein-alanine N-acetyltransferase